MQREQRVGDSEMAMRLALRGLQSSIWTALPAIVQSFNATAQTIVAQLAIKMQQQLADGSWTDIEVSPILDVPVVFPNGGGFTLTFPITAGDECLLIFSSRCIDDWWQSGGVGTQIELRMHNLSDGFALVGPRSQPRRLSSVAINATELRSDDGLTKVKLGPGSKIRLEAAQVEVHAREQYRWDVNGYGVKYRYTGSNTWLVDSYQTPRIGDTVTSTSHNISPPEIP